MPLSIPQGFRVAGVHTGVKRNPAKEDLTLVVTDQPAVAAGVYTQNLVCAAPVLVDRARTPSDSVRAIVVNAGNSNACTGEQGMRDAEEMTRLAGEVCGVPKEQALVMSTGIIGHHLPMDKITAGITAAAEQLGDSEEHLLAAARGILTTDNGAKMAGRTLSLGSREITVTGIAKGAGMIGPNMATFLGLIMTDAALTKEDLQRLTQGAADQSFNCISVEGHTSTNDTLLTVASGAAGGALIRNDELAQFETALTEVCIELARMIPADGEGASHMITIDVTGCENRAAARRIAQTIADSPLVKTAITGGDPNWGRIVSAAGYAGVSFDPAEVDLCINGHLLYKSGSPAAFEAAAVSASIKENRETKIDLTVGSGEGQCRFWTSDLTVEYVRFNSEYTT